MFSSAPSPASLGWGRGRKKKEWRPSVAVNSSHLSPGLSFNCSALPAGSSLLWSSATLFFTAFHEYHFAQRLLWGFLAPGITFDHLPLCKSASVLGASRTQYLSHAGLSSLQQIWNPKHFLKCFSPPFLFTCLNLARRLSEFWQPGVREQTFSLHRSWEEPKILMFASLSRWKRRLFFVHVGALRLFDALIKCFVLLSFGEKAKSVPLCFSLWNLRLWWEGERSRSFSPPGLSCSLALAPLFWQLNWIKGRKKILLFVLSRRQTRNEMNLIIQNIFLRV